MNSWLILFPRWLLLIMKQRVQIWCLRIQIISHQPDFWTVTYECMSSFREGSYVLYTSNECSLGFCAFGSLPTFPFQTSQVSNNVCSAAEHFNSIFSCNQACKLFTSDLLAVIQTEISLLIRHEALCIRTSCRNIYSQFILKLPAVWLRSNSCLSLPMQYMLPITKFQTLGISQAFY